jgi:hypothetical protein
VSATLEETLSLGEHLELLRRKSGDTSEHFDAIITLMWAHDPSGMPERVLLNLRNMGMEDEFSSYVTEKHRFLPSMHVEQAGLPRWWVIAPTW